MMDGRPLTLATPGRDGCGVALVARLDGRGSHETVARAITALENLEHRGAAGADAGTGDGAGLMLCLPDRFLRAAAGELGSGVRLPAPGAYALGMCFMPRDAGRRAELEAALARLAGGQRLGVLGWREVPVDEACLGEEARRTRPAIRQVFLADHDDRGVEDLERRLYVLRRLLEREGGDELVVCSLSARTVVYKGLMRAPQLARAYPDLRDERVCSPMALVHSRFSTNTLPSWRLAHPYRVSAHNGEINSLRGNLSWMRAREPTLATAIDAGDPRRLLPLVPPGASDSATLDATLEVLVRAGRTLPHALAMTMPPAWEGDGELDDELTGFFAYHAALMEPWDGPAFVVASDGRVAAARLDRNGLRPARWTTTADGWLVLASEAGALEPDPALVRARGRLGPAGMLVVDLERGGLACAGDAERTLARARPWRRWHDERVLTVGELPAPPADRVLPPLADAHRLRLAFGYTYEERAGIATMAGSGKEPDASMGDDSALAVLSERRPLLFAYFKQLFAQVTNPAIDPVRESLVMSLTTLVGRSDGGVAPGAQARAPLVRLGSPLLGRAELERLRHCGHPGLRAVLLDATWAKADGETGMEAAVERLREQARVAVERGATILVLSDRAVAPERVPVPSVLACAAVQQELEESGRRLDAAIVVDSGEPRDVHHVACLISFGADAVHPYLLLESVPELLRDGDLPPDLPADRARRQVLSALERGLMKVMSKLGIATVQSYRAARAFEAIGLDERLVARHFGGVPSRVGGVGACALAEEALDRHATAWDPEPPSVLPSGGVHAWRATGERHGWSPRAVSLLRDAVRDGDGRAERWRDYSAAVAEDARRGLTLRGLLALRLDPERAVPIDEVEPAGELVRRFATGAMSLGSISPETHEVLAVAMNRLGGRSNTGEGGEDPDRFEADPDGDLRRSSIKQVASARFGVTLEYLLNADQLQIKIAQGSKPGEGGQLPGHKVDERIGALRHATPGVELISPPPHHDIYSIEDLKQLIHDLRCANPSASVSVKLAAESGVGTIAAGVAKAGADHIVIAGHDGGTGASPLSSVHSAGVPWELGLAETQQVLVDNGLRDRVVVQVDGQLKTGRDVVVGALLGADEFGFSTAPLVALGCIMMRVCHLNTCPVGIATQDPRLRRRFDGAPEHVIAFFASLAEEVRGIVAGLGARGLGELVGRADLLTPDARTDHPKGRTVDLAALLAVPAGGAASGARPHAGGEAPPTLDDQLLAAARPALADGGAVRFRGRIRNVDRTVGGRLSSAVVSRHGARGLPDGTIDVRLHGSAGQSFGAWLAPGVALTLVGQANDYVGKGLSGGVLALRPPARAGWDPDRAVIAGNTVLYGATAGRAFLRGAAGERFAVRNSGARAVVEGVGEHGCEYMTGGVVVVLGPTGRNFAAGMSGGTAFVLDLDGRFRTRCNRELVDLEEPDGDGLETVRGLLAEHVQRTGSATAAALLEDWAAAAGRFVCVMPRAFRAALERMEAPDERAAA